MMEFVALESAQRFCESSEAVRYNFRPRQTIAERVSLFERQQHYQKCLSDRA
jgi:hypothetical protein